VIGAVLVRLIVYPMPLQDLFRTEKDIPVDRIGFLALPKSDTPTPGRSGGNNKPITRDVPKPVPAAPPLVAPIETPSVLPTIPDIPVAPVDEPGSGPIVGTPGPIRGIRPSFSDGRIWPSPANVVSAPLSPSERLDSALAFGVGRYNDSMAIVAGTASRAGDWTIDRNGKKYGIDPQFIRLGKVSIPLTVLGMLPLNIGKTGNIAAMERERALNFQRREIMEQAQRSMNEEDFRKAVRAIRERKQRERDRELAAQQGKKTADEKKVTP
jgi:hypothetical protein